MADFKIGTHDQGKWDRQDDLMAGRKPIAKGLTASQAENKMMAHEGAEVIIKSQDGTFALYELTTTEAGKSISYTDFVDGTADVDANVASRYGGSQAYLSSDAGNLRVLINRGPFLSGLDQSFARVNMKLDVQDVNGFESLGKNDLKGTLNGNLVLDQAMLEYFLALGGEEAKPLNFALYHNPLSNSYQIYVACDTLVGNISLGAIELTPSGTTLKAEASGLGAGIAQLADAGGALFGYDVHGMVKQQLYDLGEKMGFKVTSDSITSYTFSPDLQNGPLLQEIPLGDQKLKLEKIDLGANSQLNIDDNGNLVIKLDQAQVTGSSNSSSKQPLKADAEGADQLSVDVKGTFHNDLTASVSTRADLKVNITPAEKSEAQARLQALTGQSIPISGKVSVENATMQATISSKGEMKTLTSDSGQIKIENLNVDVAGNSLQINSTQGVLQAQQKDKVITLQAKNVALTGKVSSPQGSLTIQDLALDGKLTYDQTKPQQIGFDVSQGQEIRFSGALKGNGQTAVVKGLNVQNAKFMADTQAQTLTVNPAQGKEAAISLQQITMPNVNLRNISVNGTLKADLSKSQIDLDATKISFSGQLGDANLDGLKGSGHLSYSPSGGVVLTQAIKQKEKATLQRLQLPDADLKQMVLQGDLKSNPVTQALEINAKYVSFKGKVGEIEFDQLTGSGKMNFEPATGLKFTQANVNASGRVAGIEVTQLKGKGTISITPQGQIAFSDTKDLELKLAMGLEVKGNLQLSQQNGIYQVNTTSTQPVTVLYQPKDHPEINVAAKFQGSLTYNERNQEATFSSHPGQALTIEQGTLGQVQLQNATLSGQLQLKPDGSLVASPLANQDLVASGTLGGVLVQDLHASGPITFDAKSQAMTWNSKVSASLPDQGIQHLSTEGPGSMQQLPSGELLFTSNGGTINATIGQMKLENIKTNGQVLFNPATGELRFKGLNTAEFTVNGSINGRPINASSAGELTLRDTGSQLDIAGSHLKLQGVLDGFVLESTGDTSGHILVNKDFSGFDVKELNFGFKVDDVAVSSSGGLFKATPTGYEVNLSGNVQLDKERLSQLLQKISSKTEADMQVKAGIDQVLGTLNQYFSQFGQADIKYDNLTLNFDPNFQLQNYSVKTDGTVKDAKLSTANRSKVTHQVDMPMGEVHWKTTVAGQGKDLNITDGQFEFTLNEDLRKTAADIFKKEMEAYGFKKVDIEVAPNGNVHVKNLTIKKGVNINAEMKMGIHLEGQQLQLSLDKVRMKNLILEIANKLVDGKDKTADMIAQNLEQQKIEFNRSNRKGQADSEKGEVFTVNMQTFISKYLDAGFVLTGASLSETGQVKIGYSYQTKMP